MPIPIVMLDKAGSCPTRVRGIFWIRFDNSAQLGRVLCHLSFCAGYIALYIRCYF